MDHVYNSIMEFYKPTLNEFMEYHKTGDFEKLADNPVYKEIKTLIDAINIIGKYLGYENIKLSEEVKYYD